MTEEQLALARDTENWHANRFRYPRPNTTFHRGYVEDLRAVGLADASIDVVVSNCVVNLSPRKDLVLAEVLRVLKPGGELYISDVFADRRRRAPAARLRRRSCRPSQRHGVGTGGEAKPVRGVVGGAPYAFGHILWSRHIGCGLAEGGEDLLRERRVGLGNQAFEA
jgi:SAM-dependent methyltransferase